MKPDPKAGLNTLAAPSSANCISAFSKMLGLQRIARAAGLQQFGRKGRDAGDAERSPSVKRVADAQLAVVGDADDVAGPCFFGQFAVGGEEQHRVGDRHRFLVRTWVSFMPR